jgi:hypothetical protein
MEQPVSWQKMRDECAALLERRTGAGVEEWNRRIALHEFADREALREWLETRGVTGYPQMLLVMERFGYPDFFLASADELIDGQYADRAHLRPILEAILAAAHDLGSVTVQARKTYVALVGPRRTFAVVKASTKQRVDLGLRLDGGAPAGRLQDGRSLGSAAINLRLSLASPDDLDGEARGLLREAYRRNA